MTDSNSDNNYPTEVDLDIEEDSTSAKKPKRTIPMFRQDKNKEEELDPKERIAKMKLGLIGAVETSLQQPYLEIDEIKKLTEITLNLEKSYEDTESLSLLDKLREAYGQSGSISINGYIEGEKL